MSKNNLHKVFEELQHDFDVETPNAGHENRFLAKLNAQNNEQIVVDTKSTRSIWKPFLSIAASIALIVTLGIGLNTNESSNDLASISPEMAETQSFFTSTIASELTKLKEEKSPEVQALISDALKRLNILELDYESLKSDLSESGDDKLVIYAMIKNFQNRIDVLQNTLEQIEKIKDLKNSNYENSTTI